MVILRPAGRRVLGLLAGQQTSVRLWCSPFLPNRVTYHWRELPQVSFLSRQKFCACLSRQNPFFPRQKHAIILSRQIFVVTNVSLSRQTYFCRDKHVFCRDKSMLFKYFQYTSSKVLSRLAYFCCDKRRILSRQTHVCRDKYVFVAKKTFVSTKLLSRQK